MQKILINSIVDAFQTGRTTDNSQIIATPLQDKHGTLTIALIKFRETGEYLSVDVKRTELRNCGVDRLLQVYSDVLAGLSGWEPGPIRVYPFFHRHEGIKYALVTENGRTTLWPWGFNVDPVNGEVSADLT